jgi:hypothetical protein
MIKNLQEERSSEENWYWYDLIEEKIYAFPIFNTKEDGDRCLKNKDVIDWQNEIGKKFITVKAQKTVITTYEYEMPDKT